MNFNFNDISEQRTREPIPRGCYVLQLTLRPGGIGEDGWLTHSAKGCDSLNCEYNVVEGEHKGRKSFSGWS
jgi:hypothetical protein